MLVTSTVSPPNGSTSRPSLASTSRRSSTAAASGADEVDRLGHEQPLRLDAPLLQPGLQLLVQDPLVQGVLVDDDHPVVGLGDEVAVVDLDRLERDAASRDRRPAGPSGRRGGRRARPSATARRSGAPNSSNSPAGLGGGREVGGPVGRSCAARPRSRAAGTSGSRPACSARTTTPPSCRSIGGLDQGERLRRRGPGVSARGSGPRRAVRGLEPGVEVAGEEGLADRREELAVDRGGRRGIGPRSWSGGR